MLHFSSWNFFTHALASRADPPHVSSVKNKPSYFPLFFPSVPLLFQPLSPSAFTVIMRTRAFQRCIMEVADGHRSRTKQLHSTRQQNTISPSKKREGEKKIGSFAPEQSICHQQQVCVWDINLGLPFSPVLIFWINSFLKVTAAREGPGKHPVARFYTLHFFCLFFQSVLHTIHPRGRCTLANGENQARFPDSGTGWQVASLSVMVTPAGSFTLDLLFPPAGGRLSSASDLLFT